MAVTTETTAVDEQRRQEQDATQLVAYFLIFRPTDQVEEDASAEEAEAVDGGR